MCLVVSIAGKLVFYLFFSILLEEAPLIFIRISKDILYTCPSSETAYILLHENTPVVYFVLAQFYPKNVTS